MLKKFSLLFSFSLLFLLISNNDFAQTGKAPVKKKAVQKKTTAVKKTVPVKAMLSTDNAGSVRIRIITDSGTLIVKLYDSTPLHRDNFIKLVKAGFYDSLLFHRVIPGFMIQGGDPLSKLAATGTMLGNGGGDMERIPAEFHTGIIHKKGALAAARDGNPQKASSACQFYLVEGTVVNDDMLTGLEQRQNRKYTPEQRNIYKTAGGTPFLDMDYTVFGEVESGLDVISKISNVSKDANNRPLGDIRMHMEFVK